MTFETEDYRQDPDHDAQAIGDIAGWLDASVRDEGRRVRRLVARRRLAVRSIRIDYAPQKDLGDACDDILEGANDLREAGLPQPAVHLLAASFSGKSVAARDYVRRVLERGGHEPGTIPVAYAKLDTDGSVGSLATDILTALGAPRPAALTPDKRWARARQEIRDRRVSLFVLDEFQRAGRRPTISPVIAGKLLDIMDAGECGFAFLGRLSAKHVFKANDDLRKRLDSPVHIPPLRWTTDKADFMKFADAFDQALVDAEIIRSKAGLGAEDTAQLLLEAANGRIGEFSRIVETAVIMITRDGADGITRADLRDAVQEWSIGNGHLTQNPFVKAQKTGGGKKPAAKEKGGATDGARDDDGTGETGVPGDGVGSLDDEGAAAAGEDGDGAEDDGDDAEDVRSEEDDGR